MKKISLLFLTAAIGMNLFGSEMKSLKSESVRDREIEESLIREFDLKRGEDKINYMYNRVDLNGDGKNEVIVYAYGPMIGGTGGDSGLVLKERSEGYDTISKFSQLRIPIVISDKKTKGWKDIILSVSGGGAESGMVEMKFNGKKYPSNPTVLPLISDESKIKGIKILTDSYEENKGIPLE